MTSLKSFPINERIQDGMPIKDRPRRGIATRGSTAVTSAFVVPVRSSATGAGRCATALPAVRSVYQSRSAALKRTAVRLSLAPGNGRTVDPGSARTKFGFFGRLSMEAGA
jgi:hypothetical protein